MPWGRQMSYDECQAILAKWYNPWSKKWVLDRELREDILSLANSAMYCTYAHENHESSPHQETVANADN